MTSDNSGHLNTVQLHGDIPGQIDFPRSALEGSIVDRFTTVAARVSHRQAVVTAAGSTSYAELDVATNRLAHSIHAQVGDDKRPIVLLADFEISTVIAILGILKAGHPYVALQPQLPVAWLSEIIAKVEPYLILHTAETAELATRLCAEGGWPRPLDIDAASCRGDESAPAANSAANDLAAIFFTSGSTGSPKGVMRSHANVMHRVWHETADYDLRTQDRLSAFQSCMFGSSVSALFGALLNGATLYPLDLRSLSLHALANWLDDNEITICHPPITFTRQLLKDLPLTRRFDTIRAYMLSGQSFYTADISRLRRRLPPDCLIVHRFSSTETSVIARLLLNEDCSGHGPILPVGYAVPDKNVLILGEKGDPLPPGQVGQIAVRSRFLSSGYWRNPEQTAACFLALKDDPESRLYLTGDLGRVNADGLIHHEGRMDRQVKIRGYRINPLLVEAKLSLYADVDEAAVVVWDGEGREEQLVAYISGDIGDSQLVERVRAQAQTEMPHYMIPQQFILVDKLPITANGKIDRRRLSRSVKRQRQLSSPPVSPRTAIEQALTAIWQRVLQIDAVGVNDSFIALGGNSLESFRIVNEVQRVYHIDLSPNLLLKAGTVAEMALLVVHALLMTHKPEDADRLLAKRP